MFGVRHIDVRDYVDDAAVGLLRQALVFATVAGFHVKDRYMQTFRRYRRQATVGVAEYEQSVGFYRRHKFIRAVYYVSDRRSEVVSHRVHINFGIGEGEVFKKYTVERVVVVLSRVGKNTVEVLTASVNDRRKTYDFRSRSDDYEQFEASVVLKFDLAVIDIHICPLFTLFAFFCRVLCVYLYPTRFSLASDVFRR